MNLNLYVVIYDFFVDNTFVGNVKFTYELKFICNYYEFYR